MLLRGEGVAEWPEYVRSRCRARVVLNLLFGCCAIRFVVYILIYVQGISTTKKNQMVSSYPIHRPASPAAPFLSRLALVQLRPTDSNDIAFVLLMTRSRANHPCPVPFLRATSAQTDACAHLPSVTKKNSSHVSEETVSPP